MGGGKRQIINMQSCGTFQDFFSSLKDIDMKNKINLLMIIQNKKITTFQKLTDGMKKTSRLTKV